MRSSQNSTENKGGKNKSGNRAKVFGWVCRQLLSGPQKSISKVNAEERATGHTWVLRLYFPPFQLLPFLQIPSQIHEGGEVKEGLCISCHWTTPILEPHADSTLDTRTWPPSYLFFFAEPGTKPVKQVLHHGATSWTPAEFFYVWHKLTKVLGAQRLREWSSNIPWLRTSEGQPTWQNFTSCL